VVLTHVFATYLVLTTDGDDAATCMQASHAMCSSEEHLTTNSVWSATEPLPLHPLTHEGCNYENGWETCEADHFQVTWTVNGIVSVIVAVYVCAELLRKRDMSPLASEAAMCLLLNVMRLVTSELTFVVPWCRYGAEGLVALFVAGLATEVSGWLFSCRFLFMAQTRIQVLEGSMGEDADVKSIALLRHVTNSTGVLWLIAVFVGHLPCGPHQRALVQVALCAHALFQAARTVCYVIIGARLSKAVNVAIQATTLKEGLARGEVGVEAAWARKVLRQAWVGMVLPCMVNGILDAVLCVFSVLMITNAVRVTHSFTLVAPVCYLLICIADSFCLFWTVGFFTSRGPVNRERKPYRGAEIGTSLSLRPEGDEGQLWDETVRRLAQRSIDVGSLLAFYRKLGSSYVPHFDPMLHTTRDVVRQAIIPASRVGSCGVAYADVVQKGDGRLPETMVTHTWDNLFVHLVAAVVADALELSDYEAVAERIMAGQLDWIEERLRRGSLLEKTYWICAFCVNQHASICGGFPQAPKPGTPAFVRWNSERHDPVTGDVHGRCPCTQPKKFNDASECELNKFDDMMALLCHERPGFRQLIAVDQHFDLFTRAWCVAELVQAHRAEIPQSVRVLSSQVLDVNADDFGIYVKLATLTVKTCAASRIEDRDAILKRIPDLEEFDAQLQALIFGQRGLFAKRLVGFGALEAAALAARRISMAAAAAAPVALTLAGNRKCSSNPTFSMGPV